MIGWLDCASGASGDMLLGALAGAGVPMSVLTEAASAVAPEPIRLVHEQVSRSGFAATRVHVDAAESDSGRTWADIEILLAQAPLADPVRQRAASTFARLAEVEGRVHGVPAPEVHFHEVGALDAIADIVGCCAGFAHLGLSRLVATPVALGGGSVRTLHGTISVPAPAVTALLAGVPTYGGGVAEELCTPTGAALLAATVTHWGALPGLRVSATGTGAGSRDTAGRPNVLRVVLGELTTADLAADEPLDAVVLAANVDDLDPRVWPGVLAALLAAGASDAWLTPILMKKGRPAHTLSALAPAHAVDAVRRVMFTESSTIGVREHRVAKQALARETRSVRVDGAEVRVKVALLDGQVVNVSPEYDDVAAAAVALGRPVKAVLAAAAAAAHADRD